jgi:hypothetical protein
MAVNQLRVHALYVVLNEVDLFHASIRSVYDLVDGITVITTYDRDWAGRDRKPDALVQEVLDRVDDPDRKIQLIVSNETNEARSRNRVMDFVAPRSRSLAVRRQGDSDREYHSPDYFLIIDADEIYERSDLERLFERASQKRRPMYRVPVVTYLRDWTIRIDHPWWVTSLVRADVRMNDLRSRRVGIVRRVVARGGRRWHWWKTVWLGQEDVPASIAVLHHGSYVGPRDRIEEKLGSFGHAHEVRDGWLVDVWDGWHEEMRNFHPVWPDIFPSATRVAVADLPAEIALHSWPPGYLP